MFAVKNHCALWLKNQFDFTCVSYKNVSFFKLKHNLQKKKPQTEQKNVMAVLCILKGVCLIL